MLVHENCIRSGQKSILSLIVSDSGAKERASTLGYFPGTSSGRVTALRATWAFKESVSCLTVPERFSSHKYALSFCKSLWNFRNLWHFQWSLRLLKILFVLKLLPISLICFPNALHWKLQWGITVHSTWFHKPLSLFPQATFLISLSSNFHFTFLLTMWRNYRAVKNVVTFSISFVDLLYPFWEIGTARSADPIQAESTWPSHRVRIMAFTSQWLLNITWFWKHEALYFI